MQDSTLFIWLVLTAYIIIPRFNTYRCKDHNFLFIITDNSIVTVTTLVRFTIKYSAMRKVILLICILFLFGNNLIYSQGTDTFLITRNSKIYYHTKGSGAVPVLFVSGLGEDHKTWQTVQDSISKYTLTISYDRAGLGKSAYNGEKKDLASMATELKNLISSLKIYKPFILVGHSLGCQVIKKYASLYPKNIKGIIFLDPGYNEEKLRARLPDSIWQKREATLKKYLPKFNEAQQQEVNNVNKNCEMADGITALPKVPVALFTATRINPSFPGSAVELKVKQETHDHWLQFLPWAKHIEVNNSRHYIQNDAPDIVIDKLYDMTGKIK